MQTETPTQQLELLDAIAGELARLRWHLGFAPALEARFAHDQGAGRRRDLTHGGLVGLLVYDLFLINDHATRPAVFLTAVAWRMAMTVFGLLVLAAIQRDIRQTWREAAMGSTVVVVTFVSGMIFLATPPPTGIYDPFLFALILVAGNIAFPLRFIHALWSSLVSCAVTIAFLFAHPGMPDDARSFVIGLMLGAAAFTILACYRIEASSRQAYLLVLREELRSRAAQQNAEVFQHLAQTDPLTALPNRRAFDAEFERRWRQAAVDATELALLMIDIDHFKEFNDRNGHPQGDACLRAIAAQLRSTLRQEDMIARFGGEEFVVLLPVGAQLGTAVGTAERLRRAVELAAIPRSAEAGAGHVTISIGIARLAGDPATDRAQLLSLADQALYTAKRSGRNRWMLAEREAAPAI